MTLPALPLYTKTQGLTIRSMMLLALSDLVEGCSIGDLLELDVSDNVLASMLLQAAMSNCKFNQHMALIDARSAGFRAGMEKAREIYTA